MGTDRSSLVLAVLGLVLGAGLLAACESTPYSASDDRGEATIDGMSRNVHATQGGAIRDPMTPPPVRPDLANER